MARLELVSPRAGLIGTQAFHSLRLVFWGEEARGGDVVVELPVYDGRGDDGHETDEEEDAVCLSAGWYHIDCVEEGTAHLPRLQDRRWDVTEAIRQRGRDHSRQPVRSIPSGDS